MSGTSPGDRRPPSVNLLFVDDDLLGTKPFVEALVDAEFNVVCAATVEEALQAVERQTFAAAIVDVMMPHGAMLDAAETRGGIQTGIALSRRLHKMCPDLKIIGLSVSIVGKEWFEAQGFYFLTKPIFPSELVSCVRDITHFGFRLPHIFIVHGRDWHSALELKNFIQNSLQLGEPLILLEQPSGGHTIIEKFEEYAHRVDVALVLLTPDDFGELAGSSDTRPRARQNVIFELGYFVGRLGRKQGRVILLRGDGVEIPSDLFGVVYIDISQGIQAAGEDIRRELRRWIPRL